MKGVRLVDNCCIACGHLFLKSGITFAVFGFVWKIPVENDKLAKRSIGSLKAFWNSFRNLVGILGGPVDLMFLSTFIMEATSFLFVGVMKKEFLLGVFRNLEKSVCLD